MQEGQLAEPKITLEVDQVTLPFHYETSKINELETIYIGSHDSHPFKQIYGHNAKNENGFGGTEFDFEDRHGNPLKVKGLWNCSVYAINGALGTDLMPIYVEGPMSQMLFYISACDLKNIFAQHNTNYELIVAAPDNGDVIFSVKPLSKKPKNPELDWNLL